MLVLLALLLCGCGSLEVANYSGDGDVTTIGDLPTKAIKIDFAPFPMDRAHTATYDVSDLPKLRWDYQVGLAVDADIGHFHVRGWPKWPGCEATVEFTELSETGETLSRCGGTLCRFNWHSYDGDTPFSTAMGGENGLSCSAELSQRGRNTSKIKVVYQPSPDSPSFPASLRLMSRVPPPGPIKIGPATDARD